jgi:DNA-binding NtrC family response regulator
MTGGIMAKVLLVSYLAEQLHEREQVMRSAGYEVTAAQSLAAATAAIEQQIYNVAVLGFSVPEEQRNQFASELKRANPAIKILMIYFNAVPSTSLADALIPTSASPEDILRAIHHMLNDSKPSQTS